MREVVDVSEELLEAIFSYRVPLLFHEMFARGICIHKYSKRNLNCSEKCISSFSQKIKLKLWKFWKNILSLYQTYSKMRPFFIKSSQYSSLSAILISITYLLKLLVSVINLQNLILYFKHCEFWRKISITLSCY